MSIEAFPPGRHGFPKTKTTTDILVLGDFTLASESDDASVLGIDIDFDGSTTPKGRGRQRRKAGTEAEPEP